ncbi:MAG: Uncharacterised protein [SAR116 cluster bacterium]|nr:MAG: Uncharacterised protein [SAR116 cluster bacterium]
MRVGGAYNVYGLPERGRAVRCIGQTRIIGIAISKRMGKGEIDPDKHRPPGIQTWRDRLQQPVKDRVASPDPSIWRIHPFRRSASRVRQRQLDAALARALCP